MTPHSPRLPEGMRDPWPAPAIADVEVAEDRLALFHATWWDSTTCVCSEPGLTASLITNIIAAASIDLSVFAASEAQTGVSFVCAVLNRPSAAFEDNDVLAC